MAYMLCLSHMRTSPLCLISFVATRILSGAEYVVSDGKHGLSALLEPWLSMQKAFVSYGFCSFRITIALEMLTTLSNDMINVADQDKFKCQAGVT